jgi:hypothetical protein
MPVINMTPHDVNVIEDGIVKTTFPASGMQVRLSSQTVDTGKIVDGVRITTTELGEPQGLPEFKEGTFLIVSLIVKNSLPQRSDLLVPAEAVRDEQGRIIGCQSFGV